MHAGLLLAHELGEPLLSKAQPGELAHMRGQVKAGMGRPLRWDTGRLLGGAQ